MSNTARWGWPPRRKAGSAGNVSSSALALSASCKCIVLSGVSRTLLQGPGPRAKMQGGTWTFCFVRQLLLSSVCSWWRAWRCSPPARPARVWELMARGKGTSASSAPSLSCAGGRFVCLPARASSSRVDARCWGPVPWHIPRVVLPESGVKRIFPCVAGQRRGLGPQPWHWGGDPASRGGTERIQKASG